MKVAVADSGAYKGTDWQPPFRSIPSLPNSVTKVAGGSFDIFAMKKFDENWSVENDLDKADPPTEEELLPSPQPARFATADIGGMFQADRSGKGGTDYDAEQPTHVAPPIAIQRKKTTRRWLALAAAAGLVLATGAGVMWADHHRLESFGSGEVKAQGFEAPLSKTEETTPAVAANLEMVANNTVAPQVDVTPNPDLEPKPRNWPWNVLQKRVIERYGDGSGEITAEGRRVLAKMGAELLRQSAAETDLVSSAYLPQNNPEYLTQISPLLETWGGWDTEVTRINEGDGLTLSQLLAELPKDRAAHLETTLASTRMHGETLTKMMELAQNMPSPEQQEPAGQPAQMKQPTQQGQLQSQPDNDGQGFSPSMPDSGNLDGSRDVVSPYEAPNQPSFGPSATPQKEPDQPGKTSIWDTINPIYGSSDTPMPIGLWREQYPFATPEAVAEIIKRFNTPVQSATIKRIISFEPPKTAQTEVGQAPVEQTKTEPIKVEPPKFEQIRKQTTGEQVVSAVGKKMRGLFGRVGEKPERSLA